MLHTACQRARSQTPRGFLRISSLIRDRGMQNTAVAVVLVTLLLASSCSVFTGNADDTDGAGDDDASAACSFEDSIPQVLPSVFQVVTERSTGTAFYVGNGEFVTAEHSVSGVGDIKLRNRHNEIQVEVLGSDISSDIAILRGSVQGVAPLNFADSWAMAPGSALRVVGYPVFQTTDATVTGGLLSRIVSEPNGDRVLQTDAASNPGNSGGPVVDACGDVVGVVVRKTVGIDIEGIAWAVAEDSAREAMARARGAGIESGEIVDIPDPVLREAINQALGTEPDQPINSVRAATVNTLDLEGTPVQNLAGIEYLTNLKSLLLSDTEITDLTPLSELVGLEILILNDTEMTDLSPLSGLSSLRVLGLEFTGVVDLSPLSGLSSLEQLDLTDTGVVDLSPLSGLANLEALTLNETGVVDLSPLSGLASLRWLEIAGNTPVVDLSPLSGLAGLETLALAGTIDVSPLSTLPNLKGLSWWGQGIVDVSVLSTLPKLESLAIVLSKDIIDVAPLSTMTTLKNLSLFGTGVIDVSSLSALINLEGLDLADTDVVDVRPLAALTNLEGLSLAGSNVVDISPLAALTNLDTLNLKRTGVSDLSPLSGLVRLKWLGIADSGVEDTSPVSMIDGLVIE